MMKPVRIQLSRKKGFRLRDVSMALNGLPAVNVARPFVFGNRWKIGVHSNKLGRNVETTQEAVDLYRELSGWATEDHMRAYAREQLAGKNLACWCGPDDCCHASVLLEIANPPPAEGGR